MLCWLALAGAQLCAAGVLPLHWQMHAAGCSPEQQGTAGLPAVALLTGPCRPTTLCRASCSSWRRRCWPPRWAAWPPTAMSQVCGGAVLWCAGLRFLAWQLPTECRLESRDAYVLIPPLVSNHPTPIFPTALCRGRGQRGGGRGPGQRGRLASRHRRHLPHPGAQLYVSMRLAWRLCIRCFSRKRLQVLHCCCCCVRCLRCHLPSSPACSVCQQPRKLLFCLKRNCPLPQCSLPRCCPLRRWWAPCCALVSCSTANSCATPCPAVAVCPGAPP